jgi:hypothetical protein
MSLPESALVRSKVVTDPGEALAAALDRCHTGYLVLEPGDALLLDDAGRVVLTLEEGVPTHAEHTGTGRTGAEALRALEGPGPFEASLYECPPDPRGAPVEPDRPASVLAGDPELAERARRAAPETVPAEDPDSVVAFLDDEEAINDIRERAREEAQSRAEEWGLDSL